MSPAERPDGGSQISVGPVGIFWDMKNCPIPGDVSPDEVTVNIRTALRLHPLISDDVVSSFSIYGDFNTLPRGRREACQRTGVKLIDLPNIQKEAANMAIFVDIFLFALDHSPPSSILLISGDVDFAHALHVLGQRGYTIILALPIKAAVSPALRKAGHFLWDWPAVACGRVVGNAAVDRIIPAPKGKIQFAQPGDLEGFKKQVVRLMKEAGGCLPLLKLPVEYKKMYGHSINFAEYGARKLVKLLGMIREVVTIIVKGDSRMVVLLQEEEEGGSSSGIGTADPSTPTIEDKIRLVQPGVSEMLKKQVVKLMKGVGGSLPLANLPMEYAKMYGILCLAEYGADKLVKMVDMIGDVVTVVEEGKSKVVVLRQEKEEGNTSPGGAIVDAKNDISFKQPGDLAWLKKQVVMLLKGAGGSLPMTNFRPNYKKIYGHELSLAEYGAGKLGKLLEKIADVVTIVKEGKVNIVVLKGEEKDGSSSSTKRKREQQG